MGCQGKQRYSTWWIYQMKRLRNGLLTYPRISLSMPSARVSVKNQRNACGTRDQCQSCRHILRPSVSKIRMKVLLAVLSQLTWSLRRSHWKTSASSNWRVITVPLSKRRNNWFPRLRKYRLRVKIIRFLQSLWNLIRIPSANYSNWN